MTEEKSGRENNRKDPFPVYNLSAIIAEILPPFPGISTVIDNPHLFREEKWL
jgi:hypothetical protein